MSNTALAWAYAQRTGEGAGCKAVLIALADFADQDGSCYPGQELLAEMTEQSVRSVRNHVESLLALGLITREQRYSNGQRTSDRYYLQLEGVRTVDSTRVLPAESAGSSSPATSAHLPATSAGSPAESAGYPSEEPPEEPSGERARDAKPSPRQLDEEFARWYASYPRKTGRVAARRQFGLVRVRGVAFETLMKGARAYREDPNREDQYTKHPSTWLHQGCWDDDPLPPRSAPDTQHLVVVGRPQW
jgi:hypothetical protein